MVMQGIGMQKTAGGSGGLDQAALLDFHWGRVRGALDALLRSVRDEEGLENELEEIFDYFVQKVEFDSPLADR
jgi:hypothetical protein